MVIDDEVIAGDSPFAVIEPLWWLANFYGTYSDFEASLAPFSWPQRLVWAVIWHNSEVINGGHDQFFANSTGMLWPEALEGLEAIGRADLAAIVREASARFSHPPAREREERVLQMVPDDPDFDDLDRRYDDAEGDLWDYLLSYIRGQPEAFRFDGVVNKPPDL